jgi:hypothetical protein
MTRPKFMPSALTGKEAAKEVGRSSATITSWMTAGLLHPVDHDGYRGSSRYAAADVVYAARCKGADVRVAEDRLAPADRAKYDALCAGDDADDSSGFGGSGGESYDEARARKQRADASLSELKLAEARRELIPASDVSACMGRLGTMLRESVLAIESVALVQMDADAHAWLCGELRRTLERMADDFTSETARMLRGRDIGEQPQVADADG